jgi:acetyl-CoA carboxylase biotin carboxyl carrier protein
MAGKNAGSSGDSANDDIFSLDRIRKLVELMKEHDLGEVDLQQDKQKIRLTRGSAGTPVVGYPPAMPANQPPASAPSSESDEKGKGDPANILTIESPMVGTYYSKPNPDSPDFLKVGQSISPETVVCIIEAMKVFNEINAEISGKIVEILVKNEEPVDFGKALFKVDING